VHRAYYNVNDVAMNEWLNLTSVLHRKLVSLSGISKPINEHELGHIGAIFSGAEQCCRSFVDGHVDVMRLS
jgi:hypothetical protein